MFSSSRFLLGICSAKNVCITRHSAWELGMVCSLFEINTCDTLALDEHIFSTTWNYFIKLTKFFPSKKLPSIPSSRHRLSCRQPNPFHPGWSEYTRRNPVLSVCRFAVLQASIRWCSLHLQCSGCLQTAPCPARPCHLARIQTGISAKRRIHNRWWGGAATRSCILWYVSGPSCALDALASVLG